MAKIVWRFIFNSPESILKVIVLDMRNKLLLNDCILFIKLTILFVCSVGTPLRNQKAMRTHGVV